jgi:hypothetical protein
MKAVISTVSKIVLLVVAVFTMSFAQTPGTPGTTENPAELKYIGSVDNQPQFKLSLNNTESDEFLIVIKNRSGEVIYKERVKGANISRKYQVNTDDNNASGVTFEVTSKKGKARVAYAINETSRLIQDVSITAL